MNYLKYLLQRIFWLIMRFLLHDAHKRQTRDESNRGSIEPWCDRSLGKYLQRQGVSSRLYRRWWSYFCRKLDVPSDRMDFECIKDGGNIGDGIIFGRAISRTKILSLQSNGANSSSQDRVRGLSENYLGFRISNSAHLILFLSVYVYARNLNAIFLFV